MSDENWAPVGLEHAPVLRIDGGDYAIRGIEPRDVWLHLWIDSGGALNIRAFDSKAKADASMDARGGPSSSNLVTDYALE
jgi:hypothetical protein